MRTRLAWAILIGAVALLVRRLAVPSATTNIAQTEVHPTPSPDSSAMKRTHIVVPLTVSLTLVGLSGAAVLWGSRHAPAAFSARSTVGTIDLSTTTPRPASLYVYEHSFASYYPSGVQNLTVCGFEPPPDPITAMNVHNWHDFSAGVSYVSLYLDKYALILDVPPNQDRSDFRVMARSRDQSRPLFVGPGANTEISLAAIPDSECGAFPIRDDAGDRLGLHLTNIGVDFRKEAVSLSAESDGCLTLTDAVGSVAIGSAHKNFSNIDRLRICGEFDFLVSPGLTPWTLEDRHVEIMGTADGIWVNDTQVLSARWPWVASLPNAWAQGLIASVVAVSVGIFIGRRSAPLA